MYNSMNAVSTTGRLTDNVKIFDNKDGSKKVRFSVAANHNYTSKDGTKGADFIPYEAFISADAKSIGVYDKMHKGDLVQVTGSVKNNNYTDAKGVEQYGIILQVESVSLLESKAVTSARQAVAVAAAEAPEA